MHGKTAKTKKTKSFLAADAEFLAAHNATNLRQLQESNLLNLQVDELLSQENSNKDKAIAQASLYAESIMKLLTHEMPEITPQMLQAALGEASWFNHSKNESLSKTLFDQSMPSFQLLQTAASPTSYSEQDCFSNDIPIETSRSSSSQNPLPIFSCTLMVPNEIFHHNDVKNHRVFLKINSITWVVAKYLQNTLGQVVEYQKKQMSTSQPRIISIIITPRTVDNPTKKLKKEHQHSIIAGSKMIAGIPQFKKIRFRLRLNIQLQSLDWISPSRLLPNRCNLGQKDADGITSSLRYNHHVSYLARHTEFDQVRAHKTSSYGLPANLERAVRLCLIWCWQRGLLRCHDGIGGGFDDDDFSIAHVILYLFRTKSITNSMTPIQILAAFWGFFVDSPSESKAQVRVLPCIHAATESQTIANCNFAKMYAKMTRESPVTDQDPPTLLALYQQSINFTTMPIVLLDPSMRHNYLGNLSKNFLNFLREHCRISREKLYQSPVSEENLFQSLFLTETRFYNVHDAFLRIPLNDIDWGNKKSLWGDFYSRTSADFGDEFDSLSCALTDILGQALTDRVHSMRVLSTGNGRSHGNDVSRVDDIPNQPIMGKQPPPNHMRARLSPTGSEDLILGFSINSDSCFRVVDRCSSSTNNGEHNSTEDFVRLWGPRAELRRFRDGAIVHAVVWEKTESSSTSDGYYHFENDDTWFGGIVERIIRHILATHFLKSNTPIPSFAMRDIQSTVDGVIAAPVSLSLSSKNNLLTNPMRAFRSVMKVFEEFSEFLRKNTAKTVPITGTEFKSVLGLPLTIDAVEAISPSLRYASLFPPLPHPLLCDGDVYESLTKGSGVVMFPPIEIQIRFGVSSKWPTELTAIKAAKAAMLLQLVRGIEDLKRSGSATAQKDFRGPMLVTSMYADICFRGYVFRVFVRDDPELRLLRSLQSPSSESAELLRKLTRQTVVAGMHHSFMHSIYTKHPTSSAVVRLANRWLASHLLSGHIEFEAVELLVAHVYTRNSVQWHAPATILAGFMSFLKLISEFNWRKEPLLIDPGNWKEIGVSIVRKEFEQVRGDKYLQGPAMYIVTPYLCSHVLDDEISGEIKLQQASSSAKSNVHNLSWSPLFTEQSPELVVLSRVVALANRTHHFLIDTMYSRNSRSISWTNIFQEKNDSFLSFSALLRIDSAFLLNKEASSMTHSTNLLVTLNKKNNAVESTYTRSLRILLKGPKALQQKMYQNLSENVTKETVNVLLEWQPIVSAVDVMKSKLNERVLFFYNELYPEVLAIVWKPPFEPRSFSALNSEYMQPVSNKWTNDSMVHINVEDLLAEVASLSSDFVSDTKVLDFGAGCKPSKKRKMNPM